MDEWIQCNAINIGFYYNINDILYLNLKVDKNRRNDRVVMVTKY